MIHGHSDNLYKADSFDHVRLAQLVERRTREHNVSGHCRCGFKSPAGQLNSLKVCRMRRYTEVPCDGAIRRAR